MKSFLVIDEDGPARAEICQYLGDIGHSVSKASDFREALAQLSSRLYDIVIANVRIRGGDIRGLLEAARRGAGEAAVIVHADLAAIHEGAEAVKEGAFSVLLDPFSLPELNFQIRRALDRAAARESAGAPEEGAYRPYNFIGESEEIRKVFRLISKVARTNARVLILGETGTGKELVASAIHYNSLRSEGNFVRVNCAALPEQLLESELFGHEKGSFTGADRARVGRFEHADGGTIFLDEVADMSLFTQAKVLRVVQEKEFERIGSNESRKTDARIISATNKDLVDLMRRGLFREDLYYRLNVVTIRLPPLRERSGDIELLVDFFLKRASLEQDRRIRGVEPAAMRTLVGYSWPGNIRELENAIERAVLVAEGEFIAERDLSLLFAESPGSRVVLPPGGISLEEAERQLIEQALERCGWVQKRAAELLGVSGRTLNYKIGKFGLTHPGWTRNA